MDAGAMRENNLPVWILLSVMAHGLLLAALPRLRAAPEAGGGWSSPLRVLIGPAVAPAAGGGARIAVPSTHPQPLPHHPAPRMAARGDVPPRPSPKAQVRLSRKRAAAQAAKPRAQTHSATRSESRPAQVLAARDAPGRAPPAGGPGGQGAPAPETAAHDATGRTVGEPGSVASSARVPRERGLAVAAHEVLHTRPDVREPEGAAGRRAAVPPAAPKEAAGPRPDRRPEPPQAADPDRGSVPPAAVQANARAGGGAAPANSHSREVSTALSRSAALALVDLLHREIERHKRYPLIARRERREGTATVSFNLHPDGEVDGVAVDHSSGFGPLDRAAVYAVNGVAPFQPAGRFLSSVRRFRVNVVFRLY